MNGTDDETTETSGTDSIKLVVEVIRADSIKLVAEAIRKGELEGWYAFWCGGFPIPQYEGREWLVHNVISDRPCHGP